jgi:hypothetical protein
VRGVGNDVSKFCSRGHVGSNIRAQKSADFWDQVQSMMRLNLKKNLMIRSRGCHRQITPQTSVAVELAGQFLAAQLGFINLPQTDL